MEVGPLMKSRTENPGGVRYVKAMGVKVIEAREKCFKRGLKFFDSLYFGFSSFFLENLNI